jgi:predicted nucleotidyltransferase
MIAEIEHYKDQVTSLCQQYHVERLDLFGSAARGAFNSDRSDLDFIVQFKNAGEPGYARRYFDFAEALERLFSRHVDLLTERSIGSSLFRESVNRSRVTIYEDRNEKTAA